MDDILTGSFAAPRWILAAANRPRRYLEYRPRTAPVWGRRFPSERGCDILLLQEVDLNTRRTHHQNIAEEIVS